MPKSLPARLCNHESLTKEQRAYLSDLDELPTVRHAVWCEFLAGLLGSLVDGYHAGETPPDWQKAARTLYATHARDLTLSEKGKGGRYLEDSCIAPYKPVRALELLMRCDALLLERRKAKAERMRLMTNKELYSQQPDADDLPEYERLTA